MECHSKFNVTQNGMSLKTEFYLNGMSLKMEYHSKCNGTQSGMSLKMECSAASHVLEITEPSKF